MVTSDLVINIMNEFARAGTEDAPPVAEDDEAGEPATDGRASPTVEDEEQDLTVPEEEPVELPEEGPAGELEELVIIDDDLPEGGKDPPPRRSARTIGGVRRPKRYICHHTSVKKGLQEHGTDAYKAIVAELRQLLMEKKAIEPVHRGDLSARQIKRSIRSLMFLKTKFDGMGNFEKIKARLVANGKQQDRSLYPDTYSPTVGLQSVLMCLTIAAAERRKVCVIDIGGAYLNADRSCEEGDEIIMELEPIIVKILAKIAPDIVPYVDQKGRMLVKLNKAMYGTLDAAKIWYEKLTGVLGDMGYTANTVDACVFNKMVNGKQCTILVYVDDLLVTCELQEGVDEVLEQLQAAFADDIKWSQEVDMSYLGMHLNIGDGVITVSMSPYLQGVLDELGVTGTVNTPATASLFVINEASLKMTVREAKAFHTTVAKLLYLTKRVRVDALLPVAFLCTRVKAPTEDDGLKLTRLLKYLNGTVSSVLVLRPKAVMRLGGYIDASWGCHHDGKGHSGLVITLGGCTVMCMSSKQKLVTRDSTEAELVALSDKCMNVLKCHDFLTEQAMDCGLPVLLQDNTSTIALVTKSNGQYRTKYMRARQAFVKERVDAGEAEVQYLPTGRMLADIQTKPLQGALFRYMARRITGQL
jgi:hypothetical protein